jgi:hypothetical protein
VVAAFSAMQLGQRIGCFFACQVTLSKHNSKGGPSDIPVNELVTWRGLAGDGRLARALEACEENGSEALPLTSKN